VVPNIDDHAKEVTQKYGVGLNLEQDFPENIRGYLRASWNDGQTETWSFTEVDEHVSFGWDLRGNRWGRPDDKWGAAFVVNGISRNHRQYLQLGGLGFDLGDGALSYGPEEIVETYYNLPLWFMRGLYGAVDFQFINNPGYNRDRGPVLVPGVRIHLDL
jgi:carbohydrate-selective porin OprB